MIAVSIPALSDELRRRALDQSPMFGDMPDIAHEYAALKWNLRWFGRLSTRQGLSQKDVDGKEYTRLTERRYSGLSDTQGTFLPP